MTISVQPKHLILFGAAITAVLISVFVAYPKYQQYQDQQKLRAFLGVDQAQNKRSF